MPGPKDSLSLVWVHGFKGNDVTFESFPERSCHSLASTHPSLRIESKVFPAYQTRGELNAATLAFVDWLTDLVVRLECDHGEGGGAGKARIVLMGHSMGGSLIADAARDIAANTRTGDPLWPHIVGVSAFDTPYLGLHPHTFKHGLTTAASYYEQARTVASAATMLSPIAAAWGVGKWGSSSEPSSGATSPSGSTTPKANNTAEPSAKSKSWMSSISNPSAKTSYGSGASAIGAAVGGTAYYRREDFSNGWKYGYEHMTFVKNLWEEQGLKARSEGLEALGTERDVSFFNHYTHLPPCPPTHLVTRTFCILPPVTHPLYPRFTPATNTMAKDEISAHMGMFNPKTNDGFYDLGLAVAASIAERIEQEGVGKVGEVDKGSMLEGWREERQGDKVVWVEE